jgi:glycosyltransferase involved in cell wall biosynthesis
MRRSGWLKLRFPPQDLRRWEPEEVEPILRRVRLRRGLLFGSGRNHFAATYRATFPDSAATLLANADRIVAGEQPYFSRQWSRFDRESDWFRNPFTGQVVPNRHWSELDFHSPEYGDLKFMLEPARFEFAYTLVRAYHYSGREEYSEAFWTLFDSWACHNPPSAGPLWICGQESAFRILAWCFALYGFCESPHSTPQRVRRLVAMAAAHADRIQGTLDYALSQKNNHSLSEAVGLWTAGTLFPELRGAALWRKLGRKFLEKELAEQVYDDGSYVQHSTNYHRLLLQLLCWSLRLAEVENHKLSEASYSRLERAVRFLSAMTDPVTGQAPNCGSNDGTLLLPLNNCEYTDFRPVLQASHYLRRREYLFPAGPWDEDLLWLFGPEALERKRSRSGHVPLTHGHNPDRSSPGRRESFPSGGYYLLGGDDGRAMIRCARFRDRPAHCDQLHLDLWLGNIPVACDAGTYLYNGEPPWDNGLARTAVHNTVMVDGRDQMTRAGRFLWLDWARGSVVGQADSPQKTLQYWEGEHDGYRSLGVVHKRSVVCAGQDCWIVVDDVLGEGSHQAQLHWLLPDCPFEFLPDREGLLLRTAAGSCVLHTVCSQPATMSLVRAGHSVAGSPDALPGDGSASELLGWVSRYYGSREPALSFVSSAKGDLPIRFTTVFSQGSLKRARIRDLEVLLELEHKTVNARLGPLGARPSLQEVTVENGKDSERLAPAASRAGDNSPGSVHALLIHQWFASPTQAGGTRHYELARGLLHRGFQFTVVASGLSYLTGTFVTSTRSLTWEEDLDGLRVIRAYTYPSLHRSYVWRVVSFLSFMVTSVIAALRAGRPDVVLGTSPPIFQGLSAWFVAVLRRRPFVLEIRDLWPDFAMEVGVLRNSILIFLARALERFLYARAKHIIVNSPAYRDYLLGKGILPEKVTVIPNGVDPALFDPQNRGERVRQDFHLSDRFVVTYAGALGLANDVDTILRAAERLKEDSRVHFLMAGDGKERLRLEELARTMQLPNVTFAGAQPKSRMPDVIAASQACLATLKDIPMFRTTYPNKVFDYMAGGRPTILAIDGVIREVVEAAAGGIFVQPGDDAALAEAIRVLSRDREAAQAMGLRARAYVEKHFHRELQADQLAVLLRRIASG